MRLSRSPLNGRTPEVCSSSFSPGAWVREVTITHVYQLDQAAVDVLSRRAPFLCLRRQQLPSVDGVGAEVLKPSFQIKYIGMELVRVRWCHHTDYSATDALELLVRDYLSKVILLHEARVVRTDRHRPPIHDHALCLHWTNNLPNSRDFWQYTFYHPPRGSRVDILRHENSKPLGDRQRRYRFPGFAATNVPYPHVQTLLVLDSSSAGP